MKNESKKASVKFIAIVAIVLLAIGSIFAYFRSSDSVLNKFRVGRKYTITGEVVGGHGRMEGVPQSVFPGADSDDVFVNVDAGYKIGTVTVFDMNNGEKVEPGTESEASKRGEKYLIRTIRNVNCDKHIEVTLVEITEVAMIVAVPEDDEDLAELASLVDHQPVLNHTYSTLEDAIKDAEMINNQRDIDGLEGKVEIKILKDIDEVEENLIQTGNDVILDLNGKTITGEYDDIAVITIQGGGSLQVLDRTYVSDYTLQDDKTGTIKNTEGTAIKIEQGGELTLGTNNRVISRKSPTIEGAEYGIEKETTPDTIFNFYDGKIIATDATLSGSQTVDDTPKGYIFSVDASGAKKVATLQINKDIEAMIGKTPYVTLEQAFNYVNANSELGPDDEIEIDVVNTVDIDYSQIQLSANKNVVLDLNGHTINANNTKGTFINRGKMKIIDSTLNDEDAEYLELVQSPDADYGFNKVGTYYQSNNAGVANSIADSYIEIDLRNADEANHTLVINANVTSEKDNDYGYAIITESPNKPTDLTGNIFKESFATNPKYYTKELTEKKLYYLHIGYVKNATKDELLDSLFLNEVTLDNQELLEGIGFGTGKITAPICNLATGTLIIEGGRFTYETGRAFSSTNVVNTGYVELKNGNFENVIRNLEDVATIKSTGGYARAIANGDKGKIIIEDGARAYVVQAENLRRTFKTDYSDYNSSTTDARQGGGTITINGGILGGGEISSNPKLATGLANYGNTESFVVNACKVVGNVVLREEGTYNNTTFKGENEPIYVYGSVTCYTNGDEELTLKNIKVYGDITCKHNPNTNVRQDGTTTINLEDCDVAGNVDVSGGIKNVLKKYVILNVKSGNYNKITVGAYYTDLNIGIKNDENNNVLSTEKPRICNLSDAPLSYRTEANSDNDSTTVYFYDGIIIGPNNNIDDLTFTGFEEVDSEGYPTRLVIEQYEDNTNAKQITIQRAQERTARINKSYASKLDLTNIKYTSDDTYYYFYTLQNAIESCNSNENVKIELLENIGLTDCKIENGKNATIDLNGKTIKLLGNITVNEDSEIEFMSSLEGGNINGHRNTANGVQKNIFNYGTLTLKDIDIDYADRWDNSRAAYVYNYNKMNIVSGRYSYIANYGELEVTGGETWRIQQTKRTGVETTTHITGGKTIVYGNGGTVNIDSGESTTRKTLEVGVSCEDGEINVNNVELNGCVFEYSGSSRSAGVGSTGAKVSITNSIINCITGITSSNKDIAFTNSTFNNAVNLGTSSYSSTVYNVGTATISNCTVGSENSEKYIAIGHTVSNNSYVKLENTNIYGYVESINKNGNVIIGNGTRIISKNGSAIRGSGAIQLGEKDGNVSEVSPYLEGKDTTIANSSTKYYDGILVTNHTESSSYSASGLTEEEKTAKTEEKFQEAKDNTYPVGKTITILEFEDGYGLNTTSNESSYTTSGTSTITVNSTIKKVTILSLSPIAKILKTQATVQGLTASDYTENGDYYEFYKIQTALDSCKDNINAEVILLKDYAIINNTKVLTIGANKKITFDFAGKRITSSVYNCITNNGNLTLTNSVPISEKEIVMPSGQNTEALINNGTLKIGNISTQYGNIYNYGNLEIDTNEALTYTPIYNMEGNTATIKVANGNINSISNSSSSNSAVTITGGTIETLATFAGKTNISGGTFTKIYNGYRYDSNGTVYDFKSTMVATNEYNRGCNVDNIFGNSTASGNIVWHYDTMVEESQMTITGAPTISKMIFNDAKMDINVSNTINAEINNRTEAVLNLNGGTFNSLIANIQFRSSGSNVQLLNVLAGSSTGVINLNNVTVNGAIKNNGIINLGVNGDAVNTIPEINNNIATYYENELNFYDGIITASTPVSGGITKLADNTMLNVANVDNKKQYSLIPIAGNKFKVETNGTTLYKPTLQQAFAACTANNTGNADKVTALEDTYYVVADCATVEAGQKIILDINGTTLEGLSNGTIIKNNGELEITDSTKTTESYGDGQFTGSAKYVIESFGTLKLTGGNYKTRAITQSINTYIMNAEGNVELDGASIELAINSGIKIKNAQNINIKSGRIKNNSQYIGIYPLGENETNKATVNYYGDFKFEGNKQYQNGIWAGYADVTVYGDGFDNFNTSNAMSTYPITVENGTLTVEENVTFNHLLTYRGNTLITVKNGANVDSIGCAIDRGSITDNYPYLGELVVTGATINSINCYLKKATITNSNIANVDIRGSWNNGRYASERGTASITGGNIEKCSIGPCITNCILNNINITTGGLIVGNETKVRLESGNVKNLDGVGIKVSGGSTTYSTGGYLYLGTKEQGAQEVDITNPCIEGSTYGLQAYTGTTRPSHIYFYDGLIKGGTKALNSVIIDEFGSSQYSLEYDDAEQKQVHPGIIATVDNKAKIGSVEYATIQSALDAIDSMPNKTATIEMLKSVVNLSSTIVIPSGYNVTLNLKGQLITGSNAVFEVSSGATLTIIDNNGTNGAIISNSAEAINNKGTLIIGTQGGTVQTAGPKFKGETYSIVNTGTFKMYTGVLKAIETAVISGNPIADKPAGYVEKLDDQVTSGKTYKILYLEQE